MVLITVSTSRCLWRLIDINASLSGKAELCIVKPTMSLSPGEYVFLKYCNMPSNTLLNQTREDMFSGIGFILNVTRLSQNLKRLFSVGLFSTTLNRCLLIL